MMAETINITTMAEVLSDEVFAEFFWKKVGPTNENWPCEDTDAHGVKTHPSDVVFYYDEPYSNTRTYINCDLKSYAQQSITSIAIKGAIESLAKQTSCAERSEAWQKKHVHDGVIPNICSLLFVYNHDGGYDKSFAKSLDAVSYEKLGIPKGSKIVVFGPEDVFWLDNVRYEIRHMRGSLAEDKLPAPEHCRFFYPQLERKANIQLDKAKAATLEMLTSPLIVLEYQRDNKGGAKGFVLFYRRSGDKSQEFTYLLDYLRHYQLLNDNTEIQIKLLEASVNAPAMFQKAVQNYVEALAGEGPDNSLSERVKAIKFKKVNQMHTTFSTVELGMDYE